MDAELRARIAALEDAGWILVGQAESLFRFERQRLFNGTLISEQGSTLEQAIEAAEWQAERLAGLEEPRREIEDGLGSG